MRLQNKANEAIAAETAEVAAKAHMLMPGDHVEIFGLKSDAGLKLSGMTAAVARWEPNGRVRVETLLDLPSVHCVKPGNLRRLTWNDFEERECASEADEGVEVMPPSSTTVATRTMAKPVSPWSFPIPL